MSSTPHTDTSRIKRMAGPCYLLAALLVVVPLMDAAAGVLPPGPNALFWRYGATGMLSRGLLDPALGLLLASLVAIFAEHRRLRTFLTVLLSLASLVALLMIGLFVLDGMQMRGQVSPKMKTNFTIATILGVLRWLAFAVFTAYLAIRVRTRRSRTAIARDEQVDAPPTIVRRRSRSSSGHTPPEEV